MSDLNLLWMILAVCPVLGLFAAGRESPPSGDNWAEERAEMVRLLRAYRIQDERVLAAMSKIRRHLFIPETHRRLGFGQLNNACHSSSADQVLTLLRNT